MNTKIYSSVEFFHLQGKDPQSKTYYCYCLSPWLLYQTKFLILAPQNNSFVVSQIHHCCNSHSYVPAIAGWSSVVICRCSLHSYQHCLIITLTRRSYRWHTMVALVDHLGNRSQAVSPKGVAEWLVLVSHSIAYTT